MKIRLYFDEDASRHSLIRELRLRGAEVSSALDAGTNGFPDDRQLAWAAWEGEICQRMEEIRAGRARSDSFEAVFARLDQRFPS